MYSHKTQRLVRLAEGWIKWHVQRSFQQGKVCQSISDGCDNEFFQSSHMSGTMAEVADKIRQQIGVAPGYHTIPKCRSGLLKFQPEHKDLPTRSMKDSYTTAILPLGSDEKIREHYVNHLARVRMGRMMEELDIFAVWICHRHVKVPNLPKSIPLPYTFVTLMVDNVEFLQTKHRLMGNIDLTLCGHVSWTGKSSMEITMYLRQPPLTVAKAFFIMVARNAMNSGPAPVNPLVPANQQEQRCWERAKLRRRSRRNRRDHSIFKQPPTKAEEEIMYNIFTRTKGNDELDIYNRSLPPNGRWMSESFQNTILHPFPENLNSQNTIFAGYVMRNAIEVSFITACIYTSGSPLIQCISDVLFLRPVRVNSFLKLSSYVVFTLGKYIQLMVITNVLDAHTFQEEQSNAFYITYKDEYPVEEVLPRSYHETLWYINGRRQLYAYLKMKQARKKHKAAIKMETTKNVDDRHEESEKENSCSKKT